MKCFRIAILAGFFALSFAARAEEGDDLYYNPNQGKAAERRQEIEQRQIEKNTRIGVNTGFSFSGNKHFGYNSYFINPSVTVPVSSRVEVTAGVSVTDTYFNGTRYIDPESVSGGSRNRYHHTDAVLYAAATFYVNDRLTLYGSFYANMNPDRFNPFSIGKGVTVGGNYRISKSAWIGFEFSYQEGGPFWGYDPYYYYGYAGPGCTSFHNPLYRNL